jgi:hypothetical protein
MGKEEEGLEEKKSREREHDAIEERELLIVILHKDYGTLCEMCYLGSASRMTQPIFVLKCQQELWPAY